MEEMDEAALYVGDFQSSPTPTNQESPQAHKKSLIPLSHIEVGPTQPTESSLAYSNSSANAHSRGGSYTQ